ncbi:MAG: FHA domain-containing protein [Bacteroidaceae bacterium]|nr:FHA domain-containing protein [Bacteroidaceae bacterium]
MLDQNTIKIKCPQCGAVLTVKSVPGIEEKNITCPVCKTTSPFRRYEQFAASDETQYRPLPSSDDATIYAASSLRVGRLVDVATGRAYPLQSGINIVGRKATSSTADVQVQTTDRHMSRRHAQIKVVRGSASHLVHTLSNAENKNATKVNGRVLKSDDSIVLQHGDVILFGSFEMRFENQ